MYTNRVFGTAKCVLFIKMSSFQDVLITDYQRSLAHLTYVNINCHEDSRAVLSAKPFKCRCNLLAWSTPTMASKIK